MTLITANDILPKMKHQKINYDRVLKKMIASWARHDQRPSILLHSCCAPCSTFTLEYLCAHADVGIYFANSNIHPKYEYLRRAKVQKAFIEAFNARTGTDVKYYEAPYDPKSFMKMAKDKGVMDEPEGGLRCTACFEMRLEIVAEASDRLGYDYFGSALTLSPKKNAELINQLGLSVEKDFKASYLPSDFKKNNGYQRSIEMCNDYQIYRQCYCGCVFAAKAQGIDLKAVNAHAKAYVTGD